MFYIDHCITFLNFLFSTQSNGFANKITVQELHVPCYNFTQMFSKPKSQLFDNEIVMTFLNCQTNSQSSCTANVITLQEWHALCCNCAWIFSTSQSHTCLMFTIIRPFWTSQLAHLQMVGRQQHLVNIITHKKLLHLIQMLQRSSPHQNLTGVWHWPSYDLFHFQANSRSGHLVKCNNSSEIARIIF